MIFPLQILRLLCCHPQLRKEQYLQEEKMLIFRRTYTLNQYKRKLYQPSRKYSIETRQFNKDLHL